MKKEQVKNIVLTVLVVMNIVLGSQILVDKKLWSSGYNFFNVENFPILNLFIESDAKNNYEQAVHLTMPEKIIFNTGDQSTRFSLNSNNSEYGIITEYCNEILGTALALSDSKIHEVDSAEWFSSLMSQSVYLSYYTEYDSGLFANFFGLRETALSQKVGCFSNVVIGLYDNVAVYVEDAITKKYYVIRTGKRFSEFKKSVDDITNSFEKDNSEGNAINYSFDLNFDKAFGSQKTIIASMVPIYSKEQIVPEISVGVPIFENSAETNNHILNKIVSLFNVNSNVARRYKEADGTIVFVENNAILKIHTNGLIDYKANNKGVRLDTIESGYNVISQVNDFVTHVNDAAGSDNNMYLSSETQKDINNITFDYVCEGMPVKISFANMKNAVSCVVSDGHIKEYKHILRKYVKTGEHNSTPAYITAVDETIQKYSSITGEVTINKLYLAYNDMGVSEKLTAYWNVDVEDVILGNEESE